MLTDTDKRQMMLLGITSHELINVNIPEHVITLALNEEFYLKPTISDG